MVLPIKAQHDISIDAVLEGTSETLIIKQQIVFYNSSSTVLNEIHLNDWANSFSSKTTPLAKRFAENYDSSFHFEKSSNRGNTHISSITNTLGDSLAWKRGNEVDILIVSLDRALVPGDSYTLNLLYSVKLPDDKFTRYGISRSGDFSMRYWYISPGVFDGKWQVFSNKNTEDLYLLPSNFQVKLTYPAVYNLTTDLDVRFEDNNDNIKTFVGYGSNRMQVPMFLEKRSTFETIVTDKLEVITNLQDKKVNATMRALTIDRVAHFLNDKLGDYPFDKMIVSEQDYRNNPVYGLNQLPNFISPFPDGFEYDMEMLKTATGNYLESVLVLHPREDYWLYGALQIYLMMEYVDTYYPNMKIIGNLSDWWVIRWSHASDLEFNDQYPLLYLNMARNNIHQSLNTPKDSLVKFNKNIANDYYGGSGLKYLADYLGKEVLETAIKEFCLERQLKKSTSNDFQIKLGSKTDLPVNWFFESFVDQRTVIDFKIKNVTRIGDSLEVSIKNLRDHAMPVSLYGINKDSTIFKTWVRPIDSIVKVRVPAKDVRKLVLNLEQHIPEFNQRNNYKKVKGLLNRPIQFRLFQDVEDPKYNQLFFMPIFEYNLYDGFTLGPKLYNKTVLPKGIHYRLEPQYGFNSKTIVGSGSIMYTQLNHHSNLYAMRYGLAGSYYSYNTDLFYRRFSPFITFAFRRSDLRDNEKQYINIRSVNVARDENPDNPDQEPDYSILNFQYVYSNPNLINYFRAVLDHQIADKFSKVSATIEYRKLFLNNRQLNLRFFGGLFLYNNTSVDDDYFSFALDRPTDYLFDYNYYGRSEDTGLFSQQIIIAEGGFKSQLQPAFANSWITTVNASTNIWKWIYAYGDAGLVHNSERGTKAVFDTGIRLSLVADYFELYFPLYSSLGWEPGLGNYDRSIRFIVTLSPKTLLGLFTREWY